MTPLKHVAIVAPHFVPSNLTAVHRARLLASFLPDFGWDPTIITVHEKYYEEKLDRELCQLLPEGLRIKKAWAFSVKPLRLIGDIGIRGFLGMLCEIRSLHRERKIDFLYITVPSHYAALLGRICRRFLKIPYGIDYIDPWVHEWPEAKKIFSKGWFSKQLGKFLEPHAVKEASLISGVAEAYYEDVLARNPALRQRAVTVSMPYGWTEQDALILKKNARKALLFPADDGLFHLVYIGAMLPKAYIVLERLFEAIAKLCREETGFSGKFRLHFIGTGKAPDDALGHNILPYIKKFGLEALAEEYPRRIGYLDVLNHLTHASAILILGSTEKHYTPSKFFNAVAVKKPVFAILRTESTVADMIEKSQAGLLVRFGDKELPSVDSLCENLLLLMRARYPRQRVFIPEALRDYSAEQSSRKLAEAFDLALIRTDAR